MKYGLLFLLCFSTLSSIAQQAITGELIVQIRAGHTVQELFDAYPSLQLQRQLGHQSPVYLLKATEDLPLAWIDRLEATVAVQRNYPLAPRSLTPNDSLFPAQWPLRQIGAPTAWESSTGGLSPNQDTIVVAVVEFEGTDWQHPDLRPNIWQNPGEIPNDGIDNDNNSYVDDWRGWDLFSQSDVHPPAAHGTGVCSVLGAVGNNGIGMSGVNWQSQLLLLSGNRSGADLVESYWYALEQRRRYNQSGGEAGAFIVAINNSLGLAESQTPTDQPVLCNTLDSLGEAGILSVLAVPNNGGRDLDQEPDIPSNCPSPFTLTVTATDSLGELSGQAAFGAATVDLGAPGVNVPIAQPNGAYQLFRSGTSYATPLVSGAVAWLYSLPCPALSDLARTDPAAAAAFARELLLESVRPLSSLQGITSTAGQLYLPDAARLLENWCAEETNDQASFAPPFPNPTTDWLNITLPGGAPESVTYDVYDLQGRLWQSGRWERPPFAKVQFAVDVRKLPAGYYVIQLRTASASVNQKFIKHK
ncbi:MAG: S8 family serine peptidase [Bacteroidetes bacterium]|jgi:hypothetical protein|nr:S8 family serine peptidase [Bacteroidota bacterium]